MTYYASIRLDSIRRTGLGRRDAGWSARSSAFAESARVKAGVGESGRHCANAGPIGRGGAVAFQPREGIRMTGAESDRGGMTP